MFRPPYYEDDVYEEARKYAHVSERPLIFINPFRSSGYEKIYSVKTLPLSFPVGVVEPSDKPTWSVNPINQELWNLQKRMYEATSTGVPQEDELMKQRIKELYRLLTPYQKKPDSTSGNTQSAVEKQDEVKKLVAESTGNAGATQQQMDEAVKKAMPLEVADPQPASSNVVVQPNSAIAVQPVQVSNTNVATGKKEKPKALYTHTRGTTNVSEEEADAAMEKTETERQRKTKKETKKETKTNRRKAKPATH